jgi:hypothetical protein
MTVDTSVTRRTLQQEDIGIVPEVWRRRAKGSLKTTGGGVTCNA